MNAISLISKLIAFHLLKIVFTLKFNTLNRNLEINVFIPDNLQLCSDTPLVLS